MSLSRKLAGTALALAAVAILAGMAVTFSAFSSTADNSGNTFAAGTVKLTDNDTGSQLFTITGMQPLDTQSKCIKVAYTGSLKSDVKIYGTTTNDALGVGNLAPYLDTTIVRGSFPGAEPAGMDCTDFIADTGASTVFSDTLDMLPTTFDAGLADSHTPWLKDETAVYKVTVTLADNDAAQGRDATTALTFEARNLASQN